MTHKICLIQFMTLNNVTLELTETKLKLNFLTAHDTEVGQALSSRSGVAVLYGQNEITRLCSGAFSK
jgi:hypothetical protein